MGQIVHNVSDRRRSWIGSWEVVPGGLVYSDLSDESINRPVVYRDASGKAEAGAISSWRNGTVFVRFTTGDTAAGCHPSSLALAISALDGP